MSYADFGLWANLNAMYRFVEGSKTVVDGFPAIKAHLEGIENRERIKAYLARDVYKTN